MAGDGNLGEEMPDVWGHWLQISQSMPLKQTAPQLPDQEGSMLCPVGFSLGMVSTLLASWEFTLFSQLQAAFHE